MSPSLIETIKCHNGRLFNLEYHQNRFNSSRKTLLKMPTKVSLSQIIEIPKSAQSGLFRCRITYLEKIERIEFIKHKNREIKSLKLVEDNNIDYRLKFADRHRINLLFKDRGIYDDILIVKNGCITDSSTANVLFYDGKDWITPDTPLLRGTKRAQLLKRGKLKERRITPPDLKLYKKIGLINAMWDLETMPIVELGRVYQ